MKTYEEQIIDGVKSLQIEYAYEIIIRYYGLHNNTITPLKVIAKELNIDKDKVDKICRAAIRKLDILRGIPHKDIIKQINSERKKDNKPFIISFRTRQLINDINEKKRTPKKGDEDPNLLVHYHHIRSNYHKQICNSNDNNYDEQAIIEYQLVRKTLDKFSKKTMYINTIHELHRPPRFTKHGDPEKVFPDGKNQSYYYNSLSKHVIDIKKKQENNIPLSLKEIELYEDYTDIQKVVSYYKKEKQLIETISSSHVIPKALSLSGISEKKFNDGTDQGDFYLYVEKQRKTILEKIKNNQSLTLFEENIIKLYDNIQDIIKQKSSNTKKDQIIATIHKLHRPPKSKKYNNGISEATFPNGADQGDYLIRMKKRVKDLVEKKENGIELSSNEEKTIQEYLEIDRTIDLYSKTTQLIKCINELHRLPKTAHSNNGIPERKTESGTDLGQYYFSLDLYAKQYSDITPNYEAVYNYQMKKLKEYQKIKNVLSFYRISKKNNRGHVLKLCERYNIDININNSLLRKSYWEVYIKLQYLIDQNISVTNSNGVVHEIFFMSEIDMTNKYHVTIDDLTNTYINGDVDRDEKPLIKKK